RGRSVATEHQGAPGPERAGEAAACRRGSSDESHPKAIGSLLLLLEQRDRIALLPDIARAFGDLVDRRAGIVKAKITTAVALDASAQRAFVARLEQRSGHTLKATFAIDDSLLG